MKGIDIFVTVLLVIGSFNWGLVGFFGFNLIGVLFGEASTISRLIYAAIGMCGVYEAFSFTIDYEDMYHRWCDVG